MDHACCRQQFPSAPSSVSLRAGLNVKPTIPAWQMSTEQRNSQEELEQNGDKAPLGVAKSLSEDSPDVNGHGAAADVDSASTNNDTSGTSLKAISNGSALMSEVVVE